MNIRHGYFYVLFLGVSLHLSDGYRPLWMSNDSCDCTDVINQVCGSNGKTYLNHCKLHCESLYKKGLVMRHPGPCAAHGECNCPYVWDPVCGSDGMIYGNRCHLRCVAAKYSPGLHIIPDSFCSLTPEGDEGSEENEVIPDDDVKNVGLPCSKYVTDKTICNSTRCNAEKPEPLCANDGTNFRNFCEFCCVSLKQKNIKILYKGECYPTTTEGQPTTATPTTAATGGKTSKKPKRS